MSVKNEATEYIEVSADLRELRDHLGWLDLNDTGALMEVVTSVMTLTDIMRRINERVLP